MKGFLMSVVAALFLFSATPAHAWNCPTGQIRQQAPPGTSPSTPSYDVVEGIAFICVPATPPTPSNPSSQSVSTSSANSNAASTSNSVSGANSSSNATGGNSTSVSAGGNASATGGNQKQHQNQNQTQVAEGGSVSGSGNSTNSNTSSSAASNNGNGNGNGANNSSYESTTNIAATKIPVATAIAPPSGSANTCFKGFGAGVQTALVGGSFGGGKIDENCAILEAARLAPSNLARCKVYISNKYVKAAGVTLEDCLATPEPAAVVAEPVTPEPAPQATVVVPAPAVTIILPNPVPAPVPSVTPEQIEQASVAAKKVHQKHAIKPCVPQPAN